MIVMKFGGTSVEDATAIKRVAEIVKKELPKKILVVLSACSGITNELIRTAHSVRDGSEKSALEIVDYIQSRHKTIAEELLKELFLEKVGLQIDVLCNEIRNIVRGVNLLGELTSRSMDTITSYGERLSTLIFNAALEQENISTVLFDARKIMVTDATFGSAQPVFEKIKLNVDKYLKPAIEDNSIVVTQGFIGATEEGFTTTIGRGGSDYSAAIFGAFLDAEVIQIWTDVDGMMTADPRIVPDAKLIDEISFDEAAELAYFGAKVLHPNTILPAVDKNIPVKILNSRKPEVSGTIIIKESGKGQVSIVKSIASKKNIIVINVSSSRMFLAYGFLAKLFSIFANYQKSVDVVSTSEVSVSVTIDNDKDLLEIEKQLKEIGDIRIERNKAIVCVVGKGMKQTSGIAARVFSALANAEINIEMISEGASEINITLVVDQNYADEAVRVLHREFFQN